MTKQSAEAKDKASAAVDFSELGRSGIRAYSGWIRDEFLLELQGSRGAKILREMSDNDAVVGAILFCFKSLINQTSYVVKPASSSNEEDRRAAEFLDSNMRDMSFSWTDTISDCLSFLEYGWCFQELVYKKRLGDSPGSELDPNTCVYIKLPPSRYYDGLVGWRKIVSRAQSSLWKWDMDPAGGIQGMKQRAPADNRLRTIPIGKALLFRTTTARNNPEGRSILRNAYRSWFFKKKIEEIEGIGIERDLTGLPVIIPPENLDIWNTADADSVTLKNAAEELVTSVRRDEQEGVVLPFGWELKLLTTGGRRQFDTNAIISRYDQSIAMTTAADFILLGHQQVGSYALSSDKTHMFSLALGYYLDIITGIYNRYAIPRLFRLNPSFKIREFPVLEHGDVETPDLKELGAYIQSLSAAGAPLFPDDGLESHLRRVASLPISKPVEGGHTGEELTKGHPAAGGFESWERGDGLDRVEEGLLKVQDALKRMYPELSEEWEEGEDEKP